MQNFKQQAVQEPRDDQRHSTSVRSRKDLHDIPDVEIAHVVGLDLAADALTEGLLQGIFAARVNHLLSYSCLLRTPEQRRKSNSSTRMAL